MKSNILINSLVLFYNVGIFPSDLLTFFILIDLHAYSEVFATEPSRLNSQKSTEMNSLVEVSLTKSRRKNTHFFSDCFFLPLICRKNMCMIYFVFRIFAKSCLKVSSLLFVNSNGEPAKGSKYTGTSSCL